jgi:antitoxin HicB
MINPTKANPRTASSFDDFLKQVGIYDDLQACALKRALAEQLDAATQNRRLSKAVQHG